MRLETRRAKGAAPTTVSVGNGFAPHSGLREFLRSEQGLARSVIPVRNTLAPVSVVREFLRSGVLSAAALTAVMFMMAAPAVAQWLDYPTADVPKTPSGLPNLGAPTPRTADGKPDLSGIWEAENTLPCENIGNCTDLRASPQVRNIAAGLPGGLPYQPWAVDLVKQRSAGIGKDWPHSRCMPPHVGEIHTLPEFKKIIQTPGLIVILHEFNATYPSNLHRWAPAAG